MIDTFLSPAFLLSSPFRRLFRCALLISTAEVTMAALPRGFLFPSLLQQQEVRAPPSETRVRGPQQKKPLVDYSSDSDEDDFVLRDSGLEAADTTTQDELAEPEFESDEDAPIAMDRRRNAGVTELPPPTTAVENTGTALHEPEDYSGDSGADVIVDSNEEGTTIDDNQDDDEQAPNTAVAPFERLEDLDKQDDSEESKYEHDTTSEDTDDNYELPAKQSTRLQKRNKTNQTKKAQATGKSKRNTTTAGIRKSTRISADKGTGARTRMRTRASTRKTKRPSYIYEDEDESEGSAAEEEHEVRVPSEKEIITIPDESDTEDHENAKKTDLKTPNPPLRKRKHSHAAKASSPRSISQLNATVNVVVSVDVVSVEVVSVEVVSVEVVSVEVLLYSSKFPSQPFILEEGKFNTSAENPVDIVEEAKYYAASGDEELQSYVKHIDGRILVRSDGKQHAKWEVMESNNRVRDLKRFYAQGRHGSTGGEVELQIRCFLFPKKETQLVQNAIKGGGLERI